MAFSVADRLASSPLDLPFTAGTSQKDPYSCLPHGPNEMPGTRRY